MSAPGRSQALIPEHAVPEGSPVSRVPSEQPDAAATLQRWRDDEAAVRAQRWHEPGSIHLGRSMGTADGRLVGHDGTLYAHGSTTCFILDA